MSYKVGQDVHTHCGRCKQGTWHVVFALEGSVIKVQCKICMSYHRMKEETEDQTPQVRQNSPGVKRRRTGSEASVVSSAPAAQPLQPPPSGLNMMDDPPRATRSAAERKTPKSRKVETTDWTDLWEKALEGRDMQAMAEYRADQTFPEGTVLHHATFGVGVVTRVQPAVERKMQVLFRDGPKILVCSYILKAPTPQA